MSSEGTRLLGANTAAIPHRLSGTIACVLAAACIVFIFFTTNTKVIPSVKDTSTSLHSSESVCENRDFTKISLKTAFESSMVALYLDKIPVKHEMSDVIYLTDRFYAVADSSWNLFEVDRALPRFSKKNREIRPAQERPDDDKSSFEAIFEDGGVLYLVRESLPIGIAKGLVEFKATVVEVNTPAADAATYEIARECPVEAVFEGDSKGFEGAIHLHDKTGQLYMLALCEGNHCAEKGKGRERGYGKLIVTKRELNEEDGTCVWRTIRHMNIPSSAYFMDYSGINIDAAGRVLISSQEESQLWIGQMKLTEDGFFDPDTAELQGGIVLNFPRNDNCEIIYCNLEGITWVTENIIVAVSDQMKSGGRQAARCLSKDQSMHLFSLPEDWQSDFKDALSADDSSSTAVHT